MQIFRSISGYSKVRDCKAIHKHEFPGFPPKIIVSLYIYSFIAISIFPNKLQSEKDQKKLKQKEAYMKLYY